MRILALDAESLKDFLRANIELRSELHSGDPLYELRQPVGVIDPWFEYDHARVNGRRYFSERPTPHPVGMKAGTENLYDATLGWADDTDRYGAYEAFTPSWLCEDYTQDPFEKTRPAAYLNETLEYSRL